MTRTRTAVDEVDDRSLAQLSGDLTRQLGELIHHEIQQATIEVSEKARRAGLGAGALGAASVLALFGLACLIAAGIAGLALVLPWWLAALLVATACLLAAAISAQVGRVQVKRATPPIPTKAVESSKEDVAWLKEQARSARR